MPTLQQQSKQIDTMVIALQASLGRILSLERTDEVNKSILLHCAMILFYKKLGLLCANTEFISFFNRYLAHLNTKEQCTVLFNELTSPNKFDLPSNLTPQDMLEFSSVVILETHKALEKINRAMTQYCMWSLIGMHLSGICLAIILGHATVASLPMIVLLLPIMVACATVVYLKSWRPYCYMHYALSGIYFSSILGGATNVLTMNLFFIMTMITSALFLFHSDSLMVEPLVVDSRMNAFPARDLKAMIEKDKAEIYPNNFEIPDDTSGLLSNDGDESRNYCAMMPTDDSIEQRRPYSFGKIQSLFFKLPAHLIISQNDWDSANQASAELSL